MTRTALLGTLVVGMGAVGACAAPRAEGPPQRLVALPPPVTQLVPSPAVAPPANDIPESKRIAWLEAHRPVEPVRVVERERVAVHDSVPCWEPYWRDPWDDWWPLPLSIGLSFAGGRWGRHHGWGWSIGWHRGPWWW